MHFKTIRLVVMMLAAHFRLAWSAASFLSTRRSQAIEASHRLRYSAAQLANSLRRELGYGMSTAAMANEARDRVSREADRLEVEDGFGAEFLRQYVQRAPPAVLVMPMYILPREGLAPADAADAPMVTSASEETVIQDRGYGNAIARVTRCKDGKCTRSTEKLSRDPQEVDPTARDARAMDFSAKDAVGTSSQAAAGSVASSVRHMVDEMHKVDEAFGRDGFGSIFNNMFDDSEHDFGDMEKESFSGLHGNETHGSHAEAFSSSSSAILKDGKLVRVTKECKNGKCVTLRDEKVIGDAPIRNDSIVDPSKV